MKSNINRDIRAVLVEFSEISETEDNSHNSNIYLPIEETSSIYQYAVKIQSFLYFLYNNELHEIAG